MKNYLSINNQVTMEAASRSLLNIIVKQRFGVDISDFVPGEVTPVRSEGFKVDYWRVEGDATKPAYVAHVTEEVVVVKHAVKPVVKRKRFLGLF